MKPTIEERMTTMEEQHNADKAIIATQGKMLKQLENPGIKSVRDRKPPTPIVFTTEQKAERELRRYIKNAGHFPNDKGKKIKPGFRKGLSEDKKERAEKLMKILNRTEMVWDETILDFKNHQPPIVGEDE